MMRSGVLRVRLEGMIGPTDNHAMRFRAVVLPLVVAIVVQSCWAVGEWLHTHGTHEATLVAAVLNADLHYDAAHPNDRGVSQPSDSERDHHHSCFAHSPFAPTADLSTTSVTTEAFALPDPVPRSPDAPSEEIDRPNWRSPA